MNVRRMVAVLMCGFAASVPALAHHCFAAEFDDTKPVKVAGVVTKVEWLNPHIWFYVDSKDEYGNVTHWPFSGGAPGQLMRRRITKNAIQPGMTVEVQGCEENNRCPGGNCVSAP